MFPNEKAAPLGRLSHLFSSVIPVTSVAKFAAIYAFCVPLATFSAFVKIFGGFRAAFLRVRPLGQTEKLPVQNKRAAHLRRPSFILSCPTIITYLSIPLFGFI
jgi:hypothetical protein